KYRAGRIGAHGVSGKRATERVDRLIEGQHHLVAAVQRASLPELLTAQAGAAHMVAIVDELHRTRDETQLSRDGWIARARPGAIGRLNLIAVPGTLRRVAAGVQ